MVICSKCREDKILPYVCTLYCDDCIKRRYYLTSPTFIREDKIKKYKENEEIKRDEAEYNSNPLLRIRKSTFTYDIIKVYEFEGFVYYKKNDNSYFTFFYPYYNL